MQIATDQSAGIPGLEATINGLRLCNAAQSEVIANLEEYERTILGVGTDEEALAPAGYSGGYISEIEYLHCRRQALDALISAVEKYSALAGELMADEEEEETPA